jgi:hypothetical protein
MQFGSFADAVRELCTCSSESTDSDKFVKRLVPRWLSPPQTCAQNFVMYAVTKLIEVVQFTVTVSEAVSMDYLDISIQVIARKFICA